MPPTPQPPSDSSVSKASAQSPHASDPPPRLNQLRPLARFATWWLIRNPLYLLSAMFMAIGAKLYLFAPQAYAGDVGLILLTLGILQLYEFAVCGIAIALHRGRRSPEDQPSLLLVAVVFWTGPLAATLELTQLDPRLGQTLALAVSIFAASELLGLRRGLGLRLSPYATTAAFICLLLIAGGPAWIRISDQGPAAHELALFAAWWLLALALLTALPAFRWHAARAAAPTNAVSSELRGELLFLLLINAAAVTHLYAFNYAFFGHARIFYATPVLAAVAVLAIEWFAATGMSRGQALAIAVSAVLLALAAATERFDSHVALDQLILPFRDPLATALAAAALVAWFTCMRLHSFAALHVGSAFSCCLCARLFFPSTTMPPPDIFESTFRPTFPLPPLVAYLGFAVAAYLLAIAALRRRRAELAAALAVSAASLTALLFARTEFDRLIVPAIYGWTWLAVVHVLLPRPRFWSRMLPLLLLTATACTLEFDQQLAWSARGQALVMMVVLLIIGWLRPASGYRFLAFCSAAPWLALLTARAIGFGPHAHASQAVFLAFLLLSAGAVVSWNKHRLLSHADRS